MKSNLRALSIIVGLVLITLFALWPVVRCGFIVLDDGNYVTHNPHVIGPMSFASAWWLFTHTHEFLYHPLSLITFMFDHALFGLNPTGYHAVNLSIHIASAVLLFLLLRQMTGSVWRAAGAAAIFAVHPLRVESVAWVSERKDVLALFFALLAFLAYVRFAASRDHALSSGRTWAWYGLVWTMLVLSLLAKPALVTFPFLLVIIDYWPLRRSMLYQSATHFLRSSALEKLPLVALVVFWAWFSRAMGDWELISGATAVNIPVVALPIRLADAPIRCIQYLLNHFRLTRLAIPYPLSLDAPPVWQTALSLLLLAGITVAAAHQWQRRPWLTAGWAWFVVAIAPFVGIVYIGDYALADRYTYLADIGLLFAIVWSIPSVWATTLPRRAMVGGALCTVVAVLACFSRAQAGYWHDDSTLFRQAIRATDENAFAYWCLASDAANRKDHAAAIRYFIAAVKYAPDERIYTAMGDEYASLDDVAKAIFAYRTALRINERFPKARYRLAIVLNRIGDGEGAMTELERAVTLAPDYAEARKMLKAMSR